MKLRLLIYLYCTFVRQGGEKTARLQQYYLVSGKSHEIGDLLRHNDVNLAKIRHVFGDTFLTDEMREHDLQIY